MKIITKSWATKPGHKNHRAQLIELRGVPGAPEYEVPHINFEYAPRLNGQAETIRIDITKQEGGRFAVESPDCGGHLLVCEDAMILSRSHIKTYCSAIHAMNPTGGVFWIKGPFPASGLFVWAESPVAISGGVHVYCRRLSDPAEADAVSPGTTGVIETPEPECRCKSLLFGHSNDCPYYKGRR